MKRFLSILVLLFTIHYLPLTPILPSLAHAANLTLTEEWDAMSEGVTPNQSMHTDSGINSFFAGLASQTGGGRTSSGETLNAGAISTGGKFIANLVTDPPIKTGEYIADVLHNTGLAPQAYAQGIGFSGLTPVLQVWKAFRNMAYFLFILVFVVIGFMIMFRKQIDQQTVVTVQMALPKLIITLILITFSYAIAGFVVDLIYLSIFFITHLFDTFGILQSAKEAQNVIFGFSIVRIGVSYLIGYQEVAGSASTAIGQLIEGALSLPDWLQWLSNGLAYLVVAVAVLIAVFRTLFALITAYVGIIISTIFAPLQLLLNAIPGSNTFNTWLKSLVANALVFPAVATMLLIGAALVGGPSVEQMGLPTSPEVGYTNGTGWIPPLITTDTNAMGADVIRAIIGIGIIILLPEMVKIIRELLGVKESFGDLALQNLQRGTVVVTQPWNAGRTTFNEYQQQVREAEVHGRPRPPWLWRVQAGRWIGNIFGL